MAAVAHRLEIDIRNLVLGLGVLSLIAAAVSFVAVNWDTFDATMRASLLVGVTTSAFIAGQLARTRELPGTAVAMAWLGMVLLFIDVFGIQRALFPMSPRIVAAAVGGGVLFGIFLIFDAWQSSSAMRTGAVIAWLMGWFSAMGYWNVTGPDAWVLPVAVVLGWAQWMLADRNGVTGSWERYGIALVVAAFPAVITALADPNILRPIIVISVATLVVLAGLRFRQLAAVWVAGASLAVLVVAQLVDVLRGFPGWSIFALVGVALLGAGAAFEYRLRREDASDSECGQAAAPKHIFT